MRFKFLGIGYLFKCLNCIDLKSLRKKLTLIHVAFNPLFWFVDNFTYYFGFVRILIITTINLIFFLFKFFVILVWLLITNMVIVFYNCIVPELFTNSSSILFIIHFIFGSWLACNTAFHYYMGWRTKPGYPPGVSIFSSE